MARNGTQAGKGDDENKVHQISKIVEQPLLNQNLYSMNPDDAYLFKCLVFCLI